MHITLTRDVQKSELTPVIGNVNRGCANECKKHSRLRLGLFDYLKYMAY